MLLERANLCCHSVAQMWVERANPCCHDVAPLLIERTSTRFRNIVAAL